MCQTGLRKLQSVGCVAEIVRAETSIHIMALSDSCFDYLTAVAEAARELARAAHYYSDPDNPFDYGQEIDALKRSCAAAAESPYDPEAACRAIRLAASVMSYHDTVPFTPEATERKSALDKLVRTMQAELDPDEAASLPAVIEQVTTETRFTKLATERLRTMLSKLSKPAYDLAVKLISDVATASVKKMLGL